MSATESKDITVSFMVKRPSGYEELDIDSKTNTVLLKDMQCYGVSISNSLKEEIMVSLTVDGRFATSMIIPRESIQILDRFYKTDYSFQFQSLKLDDLLGSLHDISTVKVGIFSGKMGLVCENGIVPTKLENTVKGAPAQALSQQSSAPTQSLVQQVVTQPLGDLGKTVSGPTLENKGFKYRKFEKDGKLAYTLTYKLRLLK